MQTIEDINKLLDQAWAEKYYDYEKSRHLIKNAQILSLENHYEKGEMYCKLFSNILDYLLTVENDFILPNLLECLNFFENHKSEKGYVISLYFIGNVYDSFGEFYKGIDYCLRAIKYSQEINYEEGLADALATVGIIYSRIGDFKNSHESYIKALQIREKSGDLKAVASTLNRIAFNFTLNKEFKKAIDYYEQSTSLRQRINDPGGLAWSYIGFANLYEKTNENDKAIEYYQLSLENNKFVKDRRCDLHCFKGIARIYNSRGDFQKTKEYLDEAFEIAKQLNAKPILFELHLVFSEYYEKNNDFENSLFHFKEYQKIKESVLNTELQNKLKHQQISYEVENTRKEAEIYQLRNVELKHAFDILEDKNRQITKSIEYARKIQVALLPPGDYLHEIVPERFILYLPRDIVSGDFYWIDEKNDEIIIVAADCTGHGVPGAFMSMLGMAFLNEIVIKHNKLIAADILDDLRNEIIVSLRQTGRFGEPQDGMDIAICILNLKANKLQYAGANNPLCLVRNSELQVVVADKMPIGIHPFRAIPFTNHEIEIKKNDVFYIFSDGYASQFGGHCHRKFMFKNLKKMFVEIHKLPMKEQETILFNNLKNWQGNNEQIDDILVIGFKV